MLRTCNGLDDNLTREVPIHEFDADTMTLSVNWDRIRRTELTRVIRCQCGLRFDDVNRLVTYPHEWI